MVRIEDAVGTVVERGLAGSGSETVISFRLHLEIDSCKENSSSRPSNSGVSENTDTLVRDADRDVSAGVDTSDSDKDDVDNQASVNFGSGFLLPVQISVPGFLVFSKTAIRGVDLGFSVKVHIFCSCCVPVDRIVE